MGQCGNNPKRAPQAESGPLDESLWPRVEINSNGNNNDNGTAPRIARSELGARGFALFL